MRIGLWGGAVVLLLLPLAAMQFTDEVAWTAFDFLVFALMLACAGLVIEVTARMTGNRTYRAAVVVAVATAFLLFWITGAVGIIGSEDHPANRLYGAVLATAFAGSLIARFGPGGMARAMLATGLVQFTVPLLAWSMGVGAVAPILQQDVLALTVILGAMWLLAAWLFGKSAVQSHRPKTA